MTYKDFEDYLVDMHAQQYNGLDDEMPDDCNEWIGDLSSEEFIEYADVYAKTKAIEAYDKAIDVMKNTLQ